MIKAIVFDFGGVLVRTAGLPHPPGRRAWETRLALAPGELERLVHASDLWIEAQHGRLTPDEYWQAIAARLNLAESDLSAFQKDYFRDDFLDRDLITLIERLRQSGYLVGLLSNDAVTLEAKLRHEFQIFDHFDAVIISAHIGVMKPDAVAYHAVANALGVPPAECIFIDDNATNIEGARAVGMQTIHFRAGMDLSGALSAVLAEKGIPRANDPLV